MTSAISSGMSSTVHSMMYSATRRPDMSKAVDSIFSKIDTDNQGSIDQTELQSAFDQMSSSETSTDSTNVEDLFKALDSNSDNVLTKQEMTESLKKMADELGSQTGSAGMSGMPPPPPGGMGPPRGGDVGLSKDELTTIAAEASDTDSAAADSLNQLIASFEAADTNGDGKVNAQEAMAFREEQQAASSTTSSTTSTTSTSTASTSQDQNSGAALLKQIGQLLKTYGGFGQTSAVSAANSLSVAA